MRVAALLLLALLISMPANSVFSRLLFARLLPCVMFSGGGLFGFIQFFDRLVMKLSFPFASAQSFPA